MDTISVYIIYGSCSGGVAVSYVTTEFWAHGPYAHHARHRVTWPVRASSHTIAALIRDGTIKIGFGIKVCSHIVNPSKTEINSHPLREGSGPRETKLRCGI